MSLHQLLKANPVALLTPPAPADRSHRDLERSNALSSESSASSGLFRGPVAQSVVVKGPSPAGQQWRGRWIPVCLLGPEPPSGPAPPWPRPGSRDRRSFPWAMLIVDVPSPLGLMKKEWAGSSPILVPVVRQSGEVPGPPGSPCCFVWNGNDSGKGRWVPLSREREGSAYRTAVLGHLG